MNKKIIIAFAVLVAIIAAWLVLFPGKKPWTMFASKPAADPVAPAADPVTGAQTGNAMNPAAPIVKDADGFPVMYGDRGTMVAAIQEGLNLKHGTSLVVDGVFGPKTKKALSVYGYTDAITRAQYLEICL